MSFIKTRTGSIGDTCRGCGTYVSGGALHECSAPLLTAAPIDTLRDRFAMAALTAYLTANDEQVRSASGKQIAAWAYAMADTMLASREKGAGSDG